MTTRLIYHDVCDLGALSVFDEAIVAIAPGDNLRIACPYMTVNYLKRITGLSRSWRLVTDVDEWLCSLSRTQREHALAFIEENTIPIRHFSRLHAKVVIGANAALLGSANLTNSGICERTEMAIAIEDKSQVRDLQLWFDQIWEAAAKMPHDLDSIRLEMRKLPERDYKTTAAKIGFFPPSTPASHPLIKLPEPDSHESIPTGVAPTERTFVESLPPSIRPIYQEVRVRAMAFAPQVETHATRQYLAIRAGMNFAEVHRRRTDLDVHIRLKDSNIPENGSLQVHGITVTRVPAKHEWALDHKFAIDGCTPMDGVEKLLRQSFDAVNARRMG